MPTPTPAIAIAVEQQITKAQSALAEARKARPRTRPKDAFSDLSAMLVKGAPHRRLITTAALAAVVADAEQGTVHHVRQLRSVVRSPTAVRSVEQAWTTERAKLRRPVDIAKAMDDVLGNGVRHQTQWDDIADHIDPELGAVTLGGIGHIVGRLQEEDPSRRALASTVLAIVGAQRELVVLNGVLTRMCARLEDLVRSGSGSMAAILTGPDHHSLPFTASLARRIERATTDAAERAWGNQSALALDVVAAVNFVNGRTLAPVANRMRRAVLEPLLDGDLERAAATIVAISRHHPAAFNHVTKAQVIKGRDADGGTAWMTDAEAYLHKNHRQMWFDPKERRVVQALARVRPDGSTMVQVAYRTVDLEALSVEGAGFDGTVGVPSAGRNCTPERFMERFGHCTPLLPEKEAPPDDQQGLPVRADSITWAHQLTSDERTGALRGLERHLRSLRSGRAGLPTASRSNARAPRPVRVVRPSPAPAPRTGAATEELSRFAFPDGTSPKRMGPERLRIAARISESHHDHVVLHREPGRAPFLLHIVNNDGMLQGRATYDLDAMAPTAHKATGAATEPAWSDLRTLDPKRLQPALARYAVDKGRIPSGSDDPRAALLGHTVLWTPPRGEPLLLLVAVQPGGAAVGQVSAAVDRATVGADLRPLPWSAARPLDIETVLRAIHEGTAVDLGSVRGLTRDARAAILERRAANQESSTTEGPASTSEPSHPRARRAAQDRSGAEGAPRAL